MLQDLDQLASGTEAVRIPPSMPPAEPSQSQPTARKVVPSFLPTTRDKVVPFLLPTPVSPVANVEPQIEPIAQIPPPPTAVSQMKQTPPVAQFPPPNALPLMKQTPIPIQGPQQILIPSLVPATVEPEYHEIIPAFDQLAISRNISTGICNVPSGEIPNFNSLLNAESSSHTVEDTQHSSSSSSLDSSEDSDSNEEIGSARQSSATSHKEIPFFGPN